MDHMGKDAHKYTYLHVIIHKIRVSLHFPAHLISMQGRRFYKQGCTEIIFFSQVVRGVCFLQKGKLGHF